MMTVDRYFSRAFLADIATDRQEGSQAASQACTLVSLSDYRNARQRRLLAAERSKDGSGE